MATQRKQSAPTLGRGLPRPGPQFPPAPSDTVDAKLTPGEHVMNVGAVKLAGGDRLNKLNQQGIALMAGEKTGKVPPLKPGAMFRPQAGPPAQPLPNTTPMMFRNQAGYMHPEMMRALASPGAVGMGAMLYSPEAGAGSDQIPPDAGNGVLQMPGYGCGGKVPGYAGGGAVMDWLSDHTGGMIGTNKNVLATRRRSEQFKNGTAEALPPPPEPSQVISQQPAPPPQAPSGGITGAYGALQNRQKQIDEASGYALGGRVPGYAYGTDEDGVNTTLPLLSTAREKADQLMLTRPPVQADSEMRALPEDVLSQRVQSGVNALRNLQLPQSSDPKGVQAYATETLGWKPLPPLASQSMGSTQAPAIPAPNSSAQPITQAEWNDPQNDALRGKNATPNMSVIPGPLTGDYQPGGVSANYRPRPTSLNDVDQGEGFATGMKNGQRVNYSAGTDGIPYKNGNPLTGGAVSTFDSKTYADTAGKEAAHNAGMAALRAGGDYQAAYDRVRGTGQTLPQPGGYNDALMSKANWLLSQHGNIGDAQKRAQGLQLINSLLGSQSQTAQAQAGLQSHQLQNETARRGQDLQNQLGMAQLQQKSAPTLDSIKAMRLAQLQSLPLEKWSEIDKQMFLPQDRNNQWKGISVKGTDSMGNPMETPYLYNESTSQIKPFQTGQVQASGQAPQVGEIRKGYRYKGGEPGNQASWEKV